MTEEMMNNESTENEPTVSEESAAENFELEVQGENEQELQFIDSLQMFSIIESLLFASDKALSLSTLKQVFHGTTVDTKTIKKAMDEMIAIYADPSRGVTLEEAFAI